MVINIDIIEVKNLTCFGIEEGRYTINNFGNIYSIRSKKYLKPFTDRDGYKRIELTVKKNVTKKFYIHRLVAGTFVEGFSEERNIVNHKNGIKDDNFEYNLEWVTNSENDKHAFRAKLRRPTNVVFERKHVIIVCKLLERGLSNKEILKYLTGSDNIYDNKNIYLFIWRLRRRESWNDINYMFKY
ncbi:NUMOD4 domain-containing protein [Romboutsia ilealis]|uniref:NUMOD4 domain-containing protein n=1 Tax=Romboutsia ilealis TaxID=1115758 RepID=UPI00272D4977|nr:NUMOD4 domain-containing protein [Romboutsia ilealis]